MRAILLCAGFATRMYPLTENFPKPLLEIAGKPVLDYLLEQLKELRGLTEIHIVTNAKFISHFEKWQQNWHSKLAAKSIGMQLYNDGTTNNENRLGAVADLHFVLERLPDLQPTLIAAGDNIFRFQLRPLWQRFVEENKNFVTALPENDPEKLCRTGVLQIDENGLVEEFHEKPQNPPSTWTAPALYFLHPNALRHVSHYLSQPGAQDAPGHFISHLVTRENVFAAKVEGTRFDIGSMASYRKANGVLQKEPVIAKNSP